VSAVEVHEELIPLTAEWRFETPRTQIPCAPRLQFASRYPGDPRCMALHGFLPEEKLCEVDNRHDFAGMPVFDKWTCNSNGRQTVFFGCAAGGGISLRCGSRERQGFCFNAGEWNCPDAPLRGWYTRNRIYEGVLRQGRPWDRPQKGVRVEEFTFPGDPMRIDYGCRTGRPGLSDQKQNGALRITYCGIGMLNTS
jgi:hypothetical protein